MKKKKKTACNLSYALPNLLHSLLPTVIHGKVLTTFSCLIVYSFSRMIKKEKALATLFFCSSLLFRYSLFCFFSSSSLALTNHPLLSEASSLLYFGRTRNRQYPSVLCCENPSPLHPLSACFSMCLCVSERNEIRSPKASQVDDHEDR